MAEWEQIEEAMLNMQRGKLALELTQGFRTDASQEVAFVLEGGMRHSVGIRRKIKLR